MRTRTAQGIWRDTKPLASFSVAGPDEGRGSCLDCGIPLTGSGRDLSVSQLCTLSVDQHYSYLELTKATGICFVTLRRALLPGGSDTRKGALNGLATGTSKSLRLPQGLGYSQVTQDNVMNLGLLHPFAW